MMDVVEEVTEFCGFRIEHDKHTGEDLFGVWRTCLGYPSNWLSVD